MRFSLWGFVKIGGTPSAGVRNCATIFCFLRCTQAAGVVGTPKRLLSMIKSVSSRNRFSGQRRTLLHRFTLSCSCSAVRCGFSRRRRGITSMPSRVNARATAVRSALDPRAFVRNRSQVAWRAPFVALMNLTLAASVDKTLRRDRVR